MTIAVPISCPTTISPIVACRPTAPTLPIDRPRSEVSTSTTSLPRLMTSSQRISDWSRVGARRASSLPIRIARPWISFETFSGSRASRNAIRASSTAAWPRSRSNDSFAGRLLGLDDGLDRERQLAVEAEPVLERRPEERPEGAADRVRRAVDQVLPGEPVDRRPERLLVEAPGRHAERDQAVGDARDVDLVEGVDEPEEVDPLLRPELADEAEVEEHDVLRRRVDQDVARVRIAVEEPVDQDLLDDRPHERVAELARVETGLADRLAGRRS